MRERLKLTTSEIDTLVDAFAQGLLDASLEQKTDPEKWPLTQKIMSQRIAKAAEADRLEAEKAKRAAMEHMESLQQHEGQMLLYILHYNTLH